MEGQTFPSDAPRVPVFCTFCPIERKKERERKSNTGPRACLINGGGVDRMQFTWPGDSAGGAKKKRKIERLRKIKLISLSKS
jgi:hypothetical protein